MTANVARDFAATRRMTNMNRVFQIERFNQLREIVRVGVHFVAGPWLTGPPMTTAVVRNTSESVLTQENHLVFPCVRAQRPAVTEDYRLSLTPVFIVDTRSVFCSYDRHVDLLLYGLRRFGCNSTPNRSLVY